MYVGMPGVVVSKQSEGVQFVIFVGLVGPKEFDVKEVVWVKKLAGQ